MESEKKPKKSAMKKSFSVRNQVLKKEHFSNDTDLHDKQKRYETKIMPKHYKPNLAEKRVVAFSE